MFLNRPTTDVVPKSDASRVGCGGYFLCKGVAYYFTFEYDEWERKKFDEKVLTIGDLELQGIAILVHLAAPHLRHHTFTFKSDNEGSVQQLGNLRVRDEATTYLVDSCFESAATNDVYIYYEHIKGKINTEADLASRNRLAELFAIMHTQTRSPPVDLTSKIPPHLRTLRTVVRLRERGRAGRRANQ